MTNGIIVIDKPKDYTSRDIVNIVSKKLKTKQIGHTGTLDPLATGVLVLTVGKATKLSEVLTSDKKEYIATMTFGIDSDTLDITGNIKKDEDCILTKEEIINALNCFKKTYNQEVPIYSAVKVNGKKLYEYARNNEEVILPKKEVTIYEIELLEYNIENNKTVVKFKCLVSKGTYIRSLIKDIANSINKVAVMSDLRRIKQGNFDINISNNIDDEYNIIPISEVLKDYYTVEMDEKLEKKILNGCVINNIYNKEYVLFKNKDNLFLYKNENNKLKPFKMFL
ncbi:MAG: tRNA pseudouridine(55) synthase TruB [Bacilli bacterium]|nr:tRNA pseudouridine(55) synthase TruB [Bacilli bacterium]